MIRPFSALLVSMVSAAAAVPAPPDFRFKVEVLAEGMPQPMHLSRLDDGRIFFSEIAGKIRLYQPSTKAVEEVGVIEVTTANENGLLGMTLDPKFAENGWMYVLHSPKDYPGQILSRITIVNNKLDPATRKDLLKWEEQRKECCHHAGTLRFGPDGLLYISTGDNTHPFGDSDSYAPLDERPDRGPWDAQKSSGNTNDLRGKILRIRPMADGTYQVPDGNLFAPGTPLTRPEIFAMGLRNPWRFNIDAKTGIVYVGDVGPDAGGSKKDRGPRGYDTVNQIRKAGNYGWPYVRGNEAYYEFDFITRTPGPIFDIQKPINTSPNNTGAKELPPVQEPMIWYPSAGTERFPLIGSGGRTACAGPVFRFKESFRETGGFPEAFDNCLVFYDWSRPFQVWVRLDAESKMQELFPFTKAVRVALGKDDGSGRYQIKRPVDMTFGGDGALYLLDYGETWGVNQDSKLIRISYQWGNLAPEAKLLAKNAAGREPLTVSLSSEGTMDRDGDPLTYEWRLHPGGRLLGQEASLQAVLTERGAFTVEMKVNDGKGGIATANIPVTVGNAPPVVEIESPKNGDLFAPGQAIAWKVRVTDAEDGESAKQPEPFAARTLVSTSWRKGSEADLPPGLILMKQSDCFNCHAVEQKIVGPSLMDIANKYRNQAGAEELSVDRVRKGSTNVWGPLPMLAHPQHTVDELHQMVRYIYSLEPGKGGPSLVRALEGSSTAPTDGETTALTIDASYADAGNEGVASIVGQASVTLRSSRFQAEQAADIKGSMVLGFDNAGGKKGLGSIGHQHSARLRDIPLERCASITARYSSAGTGGIIEFHAEKPDGPLLASVEVSPTGAWDAWKESTVALPKDLKRTDVVIVFNKPGVSGGMMNLDWVQFNP